MGRRGDQGSGVGWSLVVDTADFESKEELEQKVPRAQVLRTTAHYPGDCSLPRGNFLLPRGLLITQGGILVTQGDLLFPRDIFLLPRKLLITMGDLLLPGLERLLPEIYEDLSL